MGSSPSVRDPEQYAFTVFGNPATHFGMARRGSSSSLNFTVAPNDFVTVTPAFLGQPSQSVDFSLRDCERWMQNRNWLQAGTEFELTQREQAVIAARSR